jgi:hypothetical protein
MRGLELAAEDVESRVQALTISAIAANPLYACQVSDA